MQTEQETPAAPAEPETEANPYRFEMSFQPAQAAIYLLARVADGDFVDCIEAREALARWKSCLATEANADAIEQLSSDEVEFDDHGVAVVEADGGYWIQGWLWVEQEAENAD
ncbi:hypothetical protein EOD42_14330 [Rhodovarius crocodyli]|uniref:Uncharacterized protein n=1 Tax=Rhodovarius crocodyli TaxID=1979269 RepID=A0A437MF45_9PROT|nr:hypothetical protein [Rhodovarius crocodyli]RVT96284.1 hypothetical protein EOD42_14330 [Rhodovarius crocodyli]